MPAEWWAEAHPTSVNAWLAKVIGLERLL